MHSTVRSHRSFGWLFKTRLASGVVKANAVVQAETRIPRGQQRRGDSRGRDFGPTVTRLWSQLFVNQVPMRVARALV